MLNGPGLRVVLWVSGCSHHCKGCHNPETWGVTSGKKFGEEELNEIYDELSKDYITGITYSGGDPLHPENRAVIAALVITNKQCFPEKTQWLYTGYTLEELQNMNDPMIDKILNTIDVLVDGKFVETLKSPDKEWVGSSNQNVIKLR